MTTIIETITTINATTQINSILIILATIWLTYYIQHRTSKERKEHHNQE